MRCPVDGTACNTKSFDSIYLDVCPTCDGVWVEKGEFRKLVKNLNIPSQFQTDEVISRWEVEVHEGTTHKALWEEVAFKCPNGHGAMQKHFFAGSDIGIDQCHTCSGIWLEGGELHAVAAEVEPNPELDRLWQMAIQDQKQLHKNVQTLSALPARIAGLALMTAKLPVMFAIIGVFVLKHMVEDIADGSFDWGQF